MEKPPPDAAALRDEAIRARRAQRVADVTCALLAQTPGLELGEAVRMMASARRAVLDLFPGRGETFDLLYRPRFLRILAERFGIPEEEVLSHP